MAVPIIDGYNEATPRAKPIGAWTAVARSHERDGAFAWEDGLPPEPPRKIRARPAVPWWDVVIGSDDLLEETVARVKGIRAEVRAIVTVRGQDGPNLYAARGLLSRLRDWHRLLPASLQKRSWILDLERWVA